MSAIRRFEVRFGGHVIVKDSPGQDEVFAALDASLGQALGRNGGSGLSRYDRLDEDGQLRVEFNAELFVDAIHADLAAEIVTDLLDGPISDAIASKSGGDWEITKIIDPYPDPRDPQYRQ